MALRESLLFSNEGMVWTTGPPEICNLREQPKAIFPDRLAECFSTVVIDEIHDIKNPDSIGNITIGSLEPDLYIGLSSTIMLHDASDCAGYLELMQPRDHKNLWSSFQVLDWGIDPEKPKAFDLAEGHGGRILQKSLRELADHMLPTDDLHQGVLLREVLAGMVIRRTYSTPIVPGSSKTIGDKLPKLCPVYLETSFHLDLQAEYRRSEGLLQNLVQYDKKSSKLVSSFKSLRQLNLNTTWAYFSYIEDVVMVANMSR